jgi:DnaK suppressor protein
MSLNNAFLRLASRLIARRDALRKTLGDDIDLFGKVTRVGGVGDRGDVAVDSANEEISSQLVEMESQQLRQIEHALERIATGAYGCCEFCGARIPATRLNTLPYASSCIDCQRKNEGRRHTTRRRHTEGLRRQLMSV